MKRSASTLLFILLIIYYHPVFSQTKSIAKLYALDKGLLFELGQTGGGDLLYRILHSEREVLGWSELGLDIHHADIGKNVRLGRQLRSSHTEKISWKIGENDIIENNYNELTIDCSAGGYNYKLLVRVFNGSVAFRYVLPATDTLKKLVIEKENTRFKLNGSFTIYQYHHESVFTPLSLASLGTVSSDLPSTLTNGKWYVSIGEAENDSYTKAELIKGPSANSLQVCFAQDSVVRATLPFKTPWRTVSVCESAIGLHAFSELPLKLNEQPFKKVPAWIKPGKLIRSDLNTRSGMDCIDLAKKLNFQYIMFDAGWYGPERAITSDPTVVIPQLDLQKVIAYGRKNGIGVILYVNYVALKSHLDTILPLYKQWGIKGLKFGFVDGFSQEGIRWLASAIRKVNDAGFILDIHDNYKPTGLSRTYPALLTQEGIRGDENSPDAFHTTVLPYTRFLAGAADFTFCFPNPKNDFSKNLKVSKAQQLALTVVYFSPLQSIFWYGKPKDYTNWDEFEFFKYVPTVWSESHYLKGEIGKNVCVARRSGQTWFMGLATGFDDWKDDIVLDFLDEGKNYTLTTYEDSPERGIHKRSIPVVKGDHLPFSINARGGMAVMIRR